MFNILKETKIRYLSSIVSDKTIKFETIPSHLLSLSYFLFFSVVIDLIEDFIKLSLIIIFTFYPNFYSCSSISMMSVEVKIWGNYFQFCCRDSLFDLTKEVNVLKNYNVWFIAFYTYRTDVHLLESSSLH